MVAHAAGADLHALRKLACAGWSVELEQDLCAAVAEERLERIGAPELGCPDLGRARWWIDERGVPWCVGSWPDARPREDGRDEQEASIGEVDVCGGLRGRVHVEAAVVPPDGLVQSGERCLGADGDERSGARGDLGLHRRRDLRPPGGDGRVPESSHLSDQLAKSGVRIVKERLGRRWHARRVGARDSATTCSAGVARTRTSSAAISARGSRGGGPMNTGQKRAPTGVATSSSARSSASVRGLAHSAHGRCTAKRSGWRSTGRVPQLL